MARAQASTMLWLILMNSTRKQPRLMDWPCFTTFRLVDFKRLCSFNLLLIRPMVSLVPYTGTFTCCRM